MSHPRCPLRKVSWVNNRGNGLHTTLVVWPIAVQTWNAFICRFPTTSTNKSFLLNRTAMSQSNIHARGRENVPYRYKFSRDKTYKCKYTKLTLLPILNENIAVPSQYVSSLKANLERISEVDNEIIWGSCKFWSLFGSSVQPILRKKEETLQESRKKTWWDKER